MNEELKEVANERKYWLERLTRTINQVEKKVFKKNKRQEPIKKDRFIYCNKSFQDTRSKLIENGMFTLKENTIRTLKDRSRKRNRSLSHYNSKFWDRSLSRNQTHSRNNNTMKANSVTPNTRFNASFTNSLSIILTFRCSEKKSIQRII